LEHLGQVTRGDSGLLGDLLGRPRALRIRAHDDHSSQGILGCSRDQQGRLGYKMDIRTLKSTLSSGNRLSRGNI
jgi:hypothetical protein